MKIMHMDARERHQQLKIRWHVWWIAAGLLALAAAVCGAVAESTPGFGPVTALAVLGFLVAVEYALTLSRVRPEITITVAGLFALLTPAAAPISMMVTAYFATTASRARRVWYTAQIAGTPLLAVLFHHLFFDRPGFTADWTMPFFALSACAIIALVSCNMPSSRTVTVAPMAVEALVPRSVAGSLLSRQIHDRIGHELTLAHLDAQRIALGVVEDDDIRQSAESASRRIDAAMREMYAIIDELVSQRPEITEIIEKTIDGVDSDGLVSRPGEPVDGPRATVVSPREAAFHEFMAGMAQSGIRIDLRFSPAVQELDLPALDMAFNIVQEGVVNAVRHGGPGEIVVSASYQRGDDNVQLVVRSPLAHGRRPVLGGSKRSQHGLTSLERELAAGGGSIERIAYGDTYVLLADVPVTFGLKPVLSVEDFARVESLTPVAPAAPSPKAGRRQRVPRL